MINGSRYPFRYIVIGMGIVASGWACTAEGNQTLEPDASSAAITGPLHLLLSEVAIAPNDHEFIEIYNPTPDPVTLTNYYLADDADYAVLPGASGMGPAPKIDDPHDFIVRFPDGAVIEAGGVRVIAMRSRDFMVAYRAIPDFGILQTEGDTAMIPAGAGLVGPDPQITNSGEGIVLFYWDGTSDLVADVDMVTAGEALDEFNRLESKTLLNVDGPDSDERVSTYRPDAFRIGTMSATAASNLSHKRISREDMFETHSRNGNGNGIFGDDETTEDMSQTWDDPAALTAPTPGVVAPGLLD